MGVNKLSKNGEKFVKPSGLDEEALMLLLKMGGITGK